MVWLDAGVDDQRTVAAPVLLMDEGVDPIDVDGGIGAGERDPQEVVKCLLVKSGAVFAFYFLDMNFHIDGNCIFRVLIWG
ncbi:MAG TPA: hypothetical protein EYN66_07430 [Myxococcales bacterium]|nr:hypothetical protein [Myxococcales bacterium]